MIEDCTLCVKTFLRPEVAARSVRSAQALYPDMPVHICDDGDGPAVDVDADRYIELPFDVGVSAGKNALLESADTEFVLFMDDDTLWSDSTRCHLGLQQLRNRPWLDMVGFRARPNLFYGAFRRENGVLQRRKGEATDVRGGVPLFDFVVNFFAARTSSMVRWADELKTMDHTEFFWRAHRSMCITRMPSVEARNTGGGSARYREHRYGRRERFARRQRALIGVDRIEDTDAYNGWRDRADGAFT